MIYSFIYFTASVPSEGKTTYTETNVPFVGMQIQDVMLCRVLLATYEHYQTSSITHQYLERYTVANVCVT